MDDADLVVIAGGGGRRLGGVDKAMLVRPDGRTVLAALLAAPVTGRRVVVGPTREGVDGVDVWTREDPPGGGPVAAIAAASPHLRSGAVVLVAGDLPFGAGAVPSLLAALVDHDAAVVTTGGHAQWLLAAWRTAALRAGLTRLGDPTGARVRALYDGVDLASVPDPTWAGGGDEQGGQWSGDLDTPADLRRLLGPDRSAGPDDGLAGRGGHHPGPAG